MAVAKVEELDDGYAFHLPADDGTAAAVSEWVPLERRCCPFLSIGVSIANSPTAIRVTLTGTLEVREFLRTELGLTTIPLRSLVRR
jgi:hypothetical protein